MLGPNDNLSLRITESNFPDIFYYGVFSGDGSEPGSLKAAAGGMDLEWALREGREQLERWIQIKNCEHDWSAMFGALPQCSKCKIVDWGEDV